MSRLEELLNKYCPDGVEYKQIKDIAEINRGIIISKKYIEENKGDYPVYSSQTENNGELGRINNYAYDGEYLTWTTDGANAGSVFYRNEKFNITNVCGLIKITEDNVITKFVYYILHIYAPKYVNRGMGNCKLMSNVMESISIPIPPIEVQKEIVRILDEFTEKTTKLQELLHRETILRKKQYEYYRDKLLTFGDEVEWKELKKVCTDFIVPMRDKPKVFDGNIPWCRIEDVEGKYFNTSLSGKFVSDKVIKEMNLKVFPIGTVICSCSASLGTYAINTQPLITNQTFIGIVCGDKLNNQYLRYYMETQTKKLVSLSNSGTIPYISRQKFEDLKIPVPPLEEQERIVKILDQFDTLCNDITKGLPAEIEMRKKQYEYYRDKLLTFKEKKK